MKFFSKLTSVALTAIIVGGGFSVNASASELKASATNTHEASENGKSTLGSIKKNDKIKVSVTFEPAEGEEPIISALDQTLPLGIGSVYYMSGSNWLLLYGSNVVSLSGNKATMIGVGTAQVKAFKSNGALLGVYTFVVSR